MASFPRLITSNLITRLFRATFVVTSRFHSIDAGHRTYATMPKNDVFDHIWLRNLFPKISSMSIKTSMTDSDEDRSLTLDTGDGYVTVFMPGIEKEKMRPCAKHHTKENYLAAIKLPDKTNQEMKDGMLTVTLPNKDEFKNDIMANIIVNIITSFNDITAKHCWTYYDMFFDRSILGNGFCPVIGMLSPINSFTIYKEETAESLSIRISMPGEEKIKLTPQGLRVSLRMHHSDDDYNWVGPENEEIMTYFDYDTFFIEGKTKKEHYITGIHMPEGIHKQHNMIKRHMKNLTFYAFIPCVRKEEMKII